MAHQQSTSYALEVDDDANGDSSSNSLYRKFRDPAIRLSFLALLVFAHISVNLCRYAFAVLEEEFETILGISEFQYAVLTGSIFVLFYSVSGVPISIAGDLINHWMILCGSILLTAFSTFFMGFATEFWGLAVCRAFQGIGLSAVVALGGSILVRLFQPKHQGVVMAFFAWGNYAGYGINYSVTLDLSDILGWHYALMIISVPALLSAICLYLLKKNTRDLRNVSDENSSESNSQIESASQPLHFRDNYGDDRNESIFHTVWEFSKHFFSHFELILISLAAGIRLGGSYVFAYYVYSYFTETLKFPESVVTECMTWIPLVGSAIGLICGGYISDLLSTRYGRRGRILFLIISGIAAFPFIFLALSGFSYKWSFSWLFIGTLFSESWLGVLIALYLSLLPKKMHASGIALAFLIIWNIAGNMTLLVDPLKSLLGEEAALIILYPGLVALSSFILWGVYPLLE